MKEKESGEEREEEEMEMAKESVKRERKGYEKYVRVEALPGQSVGFQSAGPDHTCICDKQTAKRGAGMGKDVRNSAGTYERRMRFECWSRKHIPGQTERGGERDGAEEDHEGEEEQEQERKRM